ncbi:MAG: sulfite exporter TauE/SafE family protein [Rhodocyclaceae bacterium]
MSAAPAPKPSLRREAASFGVGGVVGVLGGLLGLGGAEFRLPLLIGWFRFGALEAVILNKAVSLVVVAAALPSRAHAVPLEALAAHVWILAELLGGSLLGAWFGASWATRMRSDRLHRVIAVLLLAIAGVLLAGHDPAGSGRPVLDGHAQLAGALAAGFGIGGVAALLGVAGGELLIPTLVLLFGADIKLAGSLSLAVSLPTMLVAFARYSRDASFAVLGRQRRFVLAMAAGSLAGVFAGGRLLAFAPGALLVPLLAAILAVSAVKTWRTAPDQAR